MDAIIAERADDGHDLDECSEVSSSERRSIGALFPDPLDADDFNDEIVITTRRAIGRVALVATEAANHFQREALKHEPMSWMWTPRALFDGAAAIDACLGRGACLRGVILHGLGLGTDADRGAIDALIGADGDDLDDHEFNYLHGDRFSRRSPSRKGRAPRAMRVRLYTATIVDTRDNRMSQIFHASLARDVAEIRTRLAGRFGPDVADLADIRLGVHSASPPVIALVPAAVIELIRRMERDCGMPYARSFAVDIEMGIQA